MLLPNVRPWNPPSNDINETVGHPGALLYIDDCNSSSVNAFPPRFLFAYQIQIALKAFSFEQEPHIIGWTYSRPFGAIYHWKNDKGSITEWRLLEEVFDWSVWWIAEWDEHLMLVDWLVGSERKKRKICFLMFEKCNKPSYWGFETLFQSLDDCNLEKSRMKWNRSNNRWNIIPKGREAICS